MANENLKNLLNLAKQADEIAENAEKMPMPRRKAEHPAPVYITNDNFDEKMAELDEQVFGKYQKPKDGYDPEEELKRIKERKAETASLAGKITNPILQEVLKNPYEMDIDAVLNGCNPKMAQLEEKLGKKYGKIQEAKEICKTLEAKDKEKAQPDVSNIGNVGNIDIETLKAVIEEAIDKKLGQLAGKMQLNENMNSPKQKASMIMLGENFTFVDGDGNMYKCGDMKYVGRMKLKSK